MNKLKIWELIAIFSPFVLSFAFGLDIYVPVVPQMTQVFATSQSLVQLTLSLFLLFTGIGQLVVGPLSDQYGRRPIFFASSSAYIGGALICALAPNIYILIIGRVATSLGACGMLVTSFAVVRDLYSGDTSAKIFSFLHGAIGISPTFAPLIGGYLALFFGWRSVFLFLVFLGVLALFITNKFIQETHEIKSRVIVNKNLLNIYRDIFSNYDFLVYAILAGCAEGVFFGFFSTSPFLIIHELGVSSDNFGYYFAIFGSVIGCGGFLSGHIISYWGNKTTMHLGIALMSIGGITMLIWHYIAGLSLVGYLLPMVIACTGAVFLLGSAAAFALEPFSKTAGTAAAALGAVEFGLSALIGSLIMLFPTTSTLSYSWAIIILALISCGLLSFRWLHKQQKSEAKSA
jgi:Bcr/CflA subfamily drug resistance transporter